MLVPYAFALQIALRLNIHTLPATPIASDTAPARRRSCSDAGFSATRFAAGYRSFLLRYSRQPTKAN